jgi:hypothetical protein
MFCNPISSISMLVFSTPYPFSEAGFVNIYKSQVIDRFLGSLNVYKFGLSFTNISSYLYKYMSSFPQPCLTVNTSHICFQACGDLSWHVSTFLFCKLAFVFLSHRAYRVAMTTFRRTFHHEGKIRLRVRE